MRRRGERNEAERGEESEHEVLMLHVCFVMFREIFNAAEVERRTLVFTEKVFSVNINKNIFFNER